MSVIILIIVTMIQIPLKVSIVFLSAQQVDFSDGFEQGGKGKGLPKGKAELLGIP